MIKALWEEACQSKRRMDFFEKKVETTQEGLTALEKLTQQFLHQKSEKNLSEEQIPLLKERIRKSGSPQKIWSILKNILELNDIQSFQNFDFEKFLTGLKIITNEGNIKENVDM